MKMLDRKGQELVESMAESRVPRENLKKIMEINLQKYFYNEYIFYNFLCIYNLIVY